MTTGAKNERIAFIGLGIMGFPMARHLKKAGFEVSVWNRNFAKAEKFVDEFGGFTSQNIKEVVQNADVVLMCLGNDNSVEETTFGENGIVKFMKFGSVLIDHTTASASLAKSIYQRCLKKGIGFIDAPVTGGQAGAENGKLVVMCGGEEEIFNKIKNVLETYSLKLEYFGKAGSGQLCKMVNQICIASIIAGLSEGINFAEKAGIDAAKLFKIIESGAGGSWQMQNRHEWMLKKDYKENQGFPVEWLVKDLNICLDEARSLNADLEITSQVNEMFKRAEKEVNPRFDTSSLILLLK